MEETALEFKDMCPYIMEDSDFEEETDRCVYETLQKVHRHTVSNLEHRGDMEFFTLQFRLVFTEMEKFFKKSKILRESNKYLQSELHNTIAELQAMQKLSAIDKEMLEQLKEEMERKWNEQLDILGDKEDSKVSKKLCEKIKTLSKIENQKDIVIIELQEAIETLSKMKDVANEQREHLLKENENLRQELTRITIENQNKEQQSVLAEEKLKELMENLRTIDAELLAERNEKQQLRNKLLEMALEITLLREQCQKLEEELETKSAFNIKQEDYAKLCAEFEKANITISDLTEQKTKLEEEIEKLKDLLDKTSYDVKHLEKTIKILQESNCQLACERKDLANMLKQYEQKCSSIELGNVLCDYFYQEEEIDKCDKHPTNYSKNIFDKLTEQCEKKIVQSKESFKHLKRYRGTLKDVIKGLEEQLAQL